MTMTRDQKVQAARLALARAGILAKARSGASTIDCDTVIVIVSARDLDRARLAARKNFELEQTYVSIRAA
jgi:hypothetical protein